MKAGWFIFLLAVLLLVGALFWGRRSSTTSTINLNPPVVSEPAANANAIYEKVLALEAREEQWDRTVWSRELEAQRHEAHFQNFWDAFNASSNRWELIAALPVPEWILGSQPAVERFQHQLERQRFSSNNTVSPAAWTELCRAWQRSGEMVERIELRQLSFTPAPAGGAATSRFFFQAAIFNPAAVTRSHLAGELQVRWGQTNGVPAVQQVDASRLVFHRRVGSPWFTNRLTAEITPLPGMHVIDPLLAQDLDGDGSVELFLASRNLLFSRSSQGNWSSRGLLDPAPQNAWAALFLDLDQNGQWDLLACDREGLLLYPGQGATFAAGRRLWAAPFKILHPQVITAGDIDQDGDLDLFLGQYKIPFLGGQVPTPFDNANDGFPAFLLINRGDGTFSEETESRGLGRLRARRTYGASLVDLDLDRNLDLVVVSDFHGVDFYRNQGGGRFEESDRDFFQERTLLGMSHTIGDFNQDGRPDLMAVGMNSPLADRLVHAGLAPDGAPDFLQRLGRITEGNRLFLSGGSEEFWQEKKLPPELGRTGWSWALSQADFDHDGDLDCFLVNGHESNRSVRDYEFHFWGHDIWVGASRSDPAIAAYFNTVARRLRGGGLSYGGFEMNRLLLWDNSQWLEAGHLFGLGQQVDARNLVVDDFNQDGWVDLAWTTVEIWPKRRQTLQIWEAVPPRADEPDRAGNHWIGINLPPDRGRSAARLGSRVIMKRAGQTETRWVLAGEGYRSQPSGRVVFGLGANEKVDEVAIEWADGSRHRLVAPAGDRFHSWNSTWQQEKR